MYKGLYDTILKQKTRLLRYYLLYIVNKENF